MYIYKIWDQIVESVKLGVELLESGQIELE
jgi:hypothetical protein